MSAWCFIPFLLEDKDIYLSFISVFINPSFLVAYSAQSHSQNIPLRPLASGIRNSSLVKKFHFEKRKINLYIM